MRKILWYVQRPNKMGAEVCEEVWLNRSQLSVLFDRDVKTIGKHVNNALNEELSDNAKSVVAKFATTAADGKLTRSNTTI